MMTYEKPENEIRTICRIWKLKQVFTLIHRNQNRVKLKNAENIFSLMFRIFFLSDKFINLHKQFQNFVLKLFKETYIMMNFKITFIKVTF